ncbi:Gfo/Idh/MocA family oxidoreductase [Pelagicoccus sp. SDUM812002]|uniref:Gfo/Idh/MocA family protein n=1 Tax=Pelagicoccus sp. SDUM812002 TaxID=3041266 RepID=UPI00280FE741|nr:Gfo/Idh/MocA family oxidoreductase [Pelagicoccus sp. SDUM812002]MDQ8184117.1 Gfo/Idh/MocA family oxidoreductase [Pelagicoccus sp. SDUM812002]
MIRIGIIGTGGMGNQHALRFSRMKRVEVVSACDVNRTRVETFCAEHSIGHAYCSARDLLAGQPVDAVSVATPDAMHASIALLAIEKGRHVLCEKPLATSYEDAARMRDAAHAAGVINMVNFTYRDSPALQAAAKLVASGELGVVRHVHAHYLQSWLAQDEWGYWRESPTWLWRLSKKHGSMGVLGDVGVHILDFASMPLGGISSVRCTLKSFEKDRTGVADDYDFEANDSAAITAEFENGAIGVIHTTRWAVPHLNSLRLNLYGDKGSIELDLDRSANELLISRNVGRKCGDWEHLRCDATPSIFERFITGIRSGEQDQPDFARGALIQSALEACEVSSAMDRTVRVGENGYSVPSDATPERPPVL